MTLYEGFEVVLVAAGLSRRMGDQNKLLIEIDKTPLVRRAAQIYCDLGMRVTVVLGYEAEAVSKALIGLSAKLVINTDYEQGQQSSVRAGLNECQLDGDGLLIALCDQPLLTRMDIAKYCDVFLMERRDRILVPYWQSNRGNPVLFPSDLARKIQADGKTPGCRKFIDNNPDLVAPYQAPNRHFTTDLDTPMDAETLLSKTTPNRT